MLSRSGVSIVNMGGGRNPVWVWWLKHTSTEGCRKARQPWALRRNRFPVIRNAERQTECGAIEFEFGGITEFGGIMESGQQRLIQPAVRERQLGSAKQTRIVAALRGFDLYVLRQ